MIQVPLWRLYALRFVFLLLVLFLTTSIWPGLLRHAHAWPLLDGVARCMLAAVAIVAAIGLVHPLKMLPVLFFEIAWKGLWLIVIGFPLWSAGRLDPDSAGNFKACAIGVVLFSAVIPWAYVFEHYVRAPGDRWRRATD